MEELPDDAELRRVDTFRRVDNEDVIRVGRRVENPRQLISEGKRAATPSRQEI